MARLFGTDGVRGVANKDLTPDLALALGRAAGEVLAPAGGEIVLGLDTRPSGPMLAGALLAGLCSAGADVALAGVIPTAGVAWLTLDRGARGGAVISASHNPVEDNGIKFFTAEGMKIPPDTEDAIEKGMGAPQDPLPTGSGVGGGQQLFGCHDGYIAHLAGSLDVSLTGLKVVLDCAYGAAWEVAPRAFEECGAEVVAMNAEPRGDRINVDCGSTAPESVARRVLEVGANCGFAFDGDADRVIAVDERGTVLDGDRIIALCALRLAEQGLLENNLVVTTVMANLGFRRALERRGIEIVTTPVGDRYVAEMMSETRASLGGEQSGHVIFRRYSTTGDGILTALQIAAGCVAAGEKLSAAENLFEPFPQVLVNVRVPEPRRLQESDELWEQIRAVEDSLGEDGRVLVRPSGTEPLVRVMVEAADKRLAADTAESVAEAVKSHLGA